MFVYSKYWHNWSRLLATKHFHEHSTVEINLTGRNSQEIWIRAHGTYTPREEIHEELPDNIIKGLEETFGKELTERLLTEDFLPKIDWALYKFKCNGGAALKDVKWRFDFSNNPAEMSVDQLLEYACALERLGVQSAKLYYQEACSR